jgi:hypothetical protein
MSRTLLMAVGGTVVLLGALGFYAVASGVLGPQGVPFVSERYGYTVLLPDDSWEVMERGGIWGPGAAFVSDGPGADRVRQPGVSGPSIEVNSQEVAPGTSFEAWYEANEEVGRIRFPAWSPAASEPVELGGQDARLTRYASSDGLNAIEVTTLRGGRAYALRVWWPATPDWDPRPVVDEWLPRFSFTD